MTDTAFYVGPERKQQTEGRHSSLTEGDRVSIVTSVFSRDMHDVTSLIDRPHTLGRKSQKEKIWGKPRLALFVRTTLVDFSSQIIRYVKYVER